MFSQFSIDTSERSPDIKVGRDSLNIVITIIMPCREPKFIFNEWSSKWTWSTSRLNIDISYCHCCCCFSFFYALHAYQFARDKQFWRATLWLSPCCETCEINGCFTVIYSPCFGCVGCLKHHFFLVLRRWRVNQWRKSWYCTAWMWKMNSRPRWVNRWT